MLSSRLNAVFDEFLNKVKEEFKVVKKGDAEQKKMKKLPNPTNYRHEEKMRQEEKLSQLDDHPSFMFKRRNLLPGWYSPKQSRSIELKSRYPKKFNKPDKNHTNAAWPEGRIENLNRRKDELRKRDHVTPAINADAEPNIKKCICKHHKNEFEHLYDAQVKSRHSRNHQMFGPEGASAMRSQLRTGHHPSKKMPTMSSLTLTSVTSNSSYQ